jgi:hypothetical protein
MKTRMLALIVCLLGVVLIVSSCSSTVASPTPASTTTNGAALLQERCSVCHPLTFVEKSRHTAADWKLIVDMMISRGAQLTPEEETVAVNYLSTNFGQ